jgi:pilus assembly protein CpaF
MTSGAPTVAISVRGQGNRRHEASFRADRTLWFGRDVQCDVVLRSERVSRRHASVGVSDGVLCVTDDSANGIIVEGERLHRESRRLGRRGAFEIGPYRVEAALDERVVALPAALRRSMHRRLLDHLDLTTVQRDGMSPDVIRPDVVRALERIVGEHQGEVPRSSARAALVTELTNEALGLGPLEALLADPSVSEIMVVDPSTIFVERDGKLQRTDLRFTDGETVRAVIERIVTPLGRRIDESAPLVDARLEDGSRVNAIIPPLAVKGPCITIRKFQKRTLALADLVTMGSLTARMATFLERSVRARKNVVISGGTGSGKTTLLNALSGAIPEAERIVTIEDAAELRLVQPHVVSLESRPANMEGKGAYTIRDLLKNALRMRPDRILVGECRGGEALDMLQAMNTGHDGSMTTTHANSPREAVTRLETLGLMSGLDLPVAAIRAQIASSVHVVVQQSRMADGSRRVVSIAEVSGLDDDGAVRLDEIFQFERTGTSATGRAEGEFRATGYIPSFVDAFAALGLVHDEEPL